MAKDSQSSVLKALALAAVDHPEAGAVLGERLRANTLSDAAWTQMASVLEGNYPRPYSDNVFGDGTRVPVMTVAQVAQRQTLIDQLLLTATSPAAREALVQARTRLTSLPQ
jgi:hypothetical protein